MMINVIEYTLFMTSQYDVILMFDEVCWHSVHTGATPSDFSLDPVIFRLT